MHRDPSPSWQGPHLIAASQLFDGERMLGPCSVEIAGGVIVALHEPNEAPGGLPTRQLPADSLLAPGFIDIQVNGGGGVLLNDDPSVATVGMMAAAHRRFGTTGLLPTLITDAPDRLTTLAAIAGEALAVPGVLGFHLEGPFLNPARKGIHPPQHIRLPDEAEIALLTRFGMTGRSFLTLAPELVDGAVLKRLAAAGLRIAIGHSDATAAEVAAAVGDGATGVTHLFNAMSQMTPRTPGVVGATLADERLFAGIICDGLHVDPVNLRAAFRAMGRDRLMLVTDAMSLIGSDKASFLLHGRAITLKDGRLTDAQGTLAGAHLGMIEAVRNAVRLMGVTIEDALIMASRTPAHFLGLDKELGRIVPGHRADLVAFDATSVLATWIDGRP
ncbi:N-acetylglucosamine-6-phosphate deacetylase [Bosea sp. BE125]|uniref:N-acetylglucosamine-6-phosphate deacetylase n=1 Tax=Bosea sp. BE125 TaxID=2817909 RepID=UPI00286C2D0B|nr:N-acetylglucosamine-6-phosphate deacetylase [Bosea sp. BE125]